jgi:hypothetical protein
VAGWNDKWEEEAAMLKGMGGLSSIAAIAAALALAATLVGCKAEQQDAAGALLEAFAGSCHSQGEWTQAALAQTRVLENALLSLEKNDKCKGLSTALSSVQSLEDEIQRLAANPSVTAEKQAQETKRQILLELNQATDPAVRDALVAALAQAEVGLANARAGAASSMDAQGNTAMVRGLTQMSGYLTTLLSAQTNLSECAHENPMIGVQVGAGVLAIAGTFVNPAVGAAVSMAGQLLSSVVDFARREQLHKKLRKVKAVELEAALACGLESMANTYCQAQDLYTLAKLQADSYPAQWQPTRFWAGLDLWSRKVPRFLAWAQKLASGAEPADRASGERQNEAWGAVQMLQAVERKSRGLIAETERKLHQAPEVDSADNWQEMVVRRGLSQLLNEMHSSPTCTMGCSPFSPIARYYSTRTALLYRLARDSKPPDDQNQWKNEDNIELPPNGFADIVVRANLVFTEIYQQLLADLRLVIDVDPSGLLREALQPEVVGQESPIEVIRDAIGFLDESARYFESIGTPEAAKMVPLIRDTQTILSEAAAAILTAPGNTEGDRKVVTELFTRLNLLYGIEFISGRIYRHIKWDLNTRIENGEAPQDVTDLLRASGRDAARELTGSSRSSLDELLQDISTSQAISQRNVENFVSLFHGAFEEGLKRIRDAANRAGEPLEGPHRPNRMLQARMCVLLLTTSYEWPRNVDRTLCEGAVLESIYPALTEKLRFEELEGLLAGLPLEKRMCTYQHFLRRSRLFATRPQPRE